MVLILISSSHHYLLIKVDKDQVWRNLDTTYEWVSHSLLIRSTWQIQLVLVTDTAHYCSLVISPLWPITMQHFQTTDQSEHSTQWHVFDQRHCNVWCYRYWSWWWWSRAWQQTTLESWSSGHDTHHDPDTGVAELILLLIDLTSSSMIYAITKYIHL